MAEQLLASPAPTAFERVAAAYVQSRLSPHTRRFYSRELRLWLAHCAALGVDPARPSATAAAAFRDALLEHLKPESAGRGLAVLSAIYRYAREQEEPAASWNPFTQRALPRPDPGAFGRTRPVLDEVAQRMIDAAAAESPRDAAALALLYSTGLRRSSVAGVELGGVYRSRSVLIVRTRVKGGEEVEAEVPAPYDAIVERQFRQVEGDHLFPDRGGAGPMHPATVYKIVEKWADRVGAEGVHPHGFRAAFVTGLYDAGARERDIQAAVHHKDPRSTQRYDRGRRGAGATALLAAHREKGLR